MDNITHGLLGAAVAMLRGRDGGPEHDTPVTPTDKAAVWAAFIASELPDIDVFFGSGPMDSLVYHRGLTHALLYAPVSAAVAAGLTKLLWREARLGTLYVWSLASLLLVHLLPDWLTGWGTQLLLPFSNAKLGLDWVPIVDWVVLLALIPCVLLAWRRPHLRRRLSAGALAFVALFWIGYRGTAHTIVQANVTKAYAGQAVEKLQVSPDLFNPVKWRYTVELADRYEQGDAYPWQLGAVSTTLAKSSEDEVTRAVRNAAEVRPFFDHYRFPMVTYTQSGGGYAVILYDVRYAALGRNMGYLVLLDQNLKVMQVTSPEY